MIYLKKKHIFHNLYKAICGQKITVVSLNCFFFSNIFVFFDEWQTENSLGNHMGEEYFEQVNVSLASLPHLV